MNWSEIIKKLRNKMLLSQKEFANMLEVSFASINRQKNGYHSPTLKAKRKIKELCIKQNINVDYID